MTKFVPGDLLKPKSTIGHHALVMKLKVITLASNVVFDTVTLEKILATETVLVLANISVTNGSVCPISLVLTSPGNALMWLPDDDIVRNLVLA